MTDRVAGGDGEATPSPTIEVPASPATGDARWWGWAGAVGAVLTAVGAVLGGGSVAISAQAGPLTVIAGHLADAYVRMMAGFALHLVGVPLLLLFFAGLRPWLSSRRTPPLLCAVAGSCGQVAVTVSLVGAGLAAAGAAGAHEGQNVTAVVSAYYAGEELSLLPWILIAVPAVLVAVTAPGGRTPPLWRRITGVLLGLLVLVAIPVAPALAGPALLWVLLVGVSTSLSRGGRNQSSPAAA